MLAEAAAHMPAARFEARTGGLEMLRSLFQDRPLPGDAHIGFDWQGCNAHD